jgi:hypothetical protein
MAIGQTYLTLADKFKRQNGNEHIAAIIEILAEYNTMIQDAPVIECNNGTKHRTTMRTALPSVGWRVLNEGVAESKSSTTQVEDATGILEGWSRVDQALVDLAVDKAGFRLSESRAFLEAMNNEAESGLFYHNTNTDPERILGLAPRFGDGRATVENGGQIINALGAGGDNTSVWFITWGEQTCHLIYPKGTMGGLQHEDLGLDTVMDSNNNPFRAYRDRYCWNLGLSVRDWRSVARVANIETGALSVDASTGANLFDKMVDAYWKLQNQGTAQGKKVIYANSTILEYLDHQSRLGNPNVQLTWREAGPDSEPVLHFRDMPIRRSDALVNSESPVPFV